MSPIRRFTALLTGVLVLQLTLLGAAAPCSEDGAEQGTASGHGEMGHAVMDHAPVEGASEQNRCGDHPAETGWPTSSGNASCIAMISCVAPLLLDAQPAVTAGAVYMHVASALVLEPPTRTTVPELPPPRA